ncbi:hypothetical protein SLEP1_g7838 [Rubroshorea leprosula]|uniref:Uncharacterized protein n=1 Tax=Rubroshorea leprosula TaxID=152421 RepID=A0AAV5HZN7_9ROSI|nr:hypothetical protein SLEP1_g7838 [Rubroshorea leprosula]
MHSSLVQHTESISIVGGSVLGFKKSSNSESDDLKPSLFLQLLSSLLDSLPLVHALPSPFGSLPLHFFVQTTAAPPAEIG